MRKRVILTSMMIVILLLLCSCENVTENSYDEIPGYMIEKICESNGQSVDFVYTDDFGEDKYLSSIYNVELDSPQYHMQINISNPKNLTGTMTIGAFREFFNYDDLENDFEKYYKLVVDLANLYNDYPISEDQIDTFFKDETNIIRENCLREDEGIWYVIEKEAELSEGCWVTYKITTFANDNGDGPENDSSFEEEWIIYCFEQEG